MSASRRGARGGAAASNPQSTGPSFWDDHRISLLQYEASQGKPLDQAAINEARERLKQITPSSPLWFGDRGPA